MNCAGYTGKSETEDGFTQIHRLSGTDQFSVEQSLNRLGFNRWLYDDPGMYAEVVRSLMEGKLTPIYFTHDGLDYQRVVYANPLASEVEVDTGETLKRGMYDRPPIWHLSKHNIHFPTDLKLLAMIQENYDGFVKAFQNEGVPTQLLGQLKTNMESLAPSFKVRNEEALERGNAVTEQFFRKSERSDMYYWNKTFVSFSDGKREDHHTFSRDNEVPERNISYNAMVNMVAYGTPVLRQYPEGRQTKEQWVWLDPNSFTTPEKENHKMKYKDASMVDLDAYFKKSNLVHKDDPEVVQTAKELIKRGELVKGLFQVGDEKKEFFYAPNLTFNRFDVYDSDMKLVRGNVLNPGQHQAATQKTLQAEGQNQQQTPAATQRQAQQHTPSEQRNNGTHRSNRPTPDKEDLDKRTSRRRQRG
jgi:hypothetical protein